MAESVMGQGMETWLKKECVAMAEYPLDINAYLTIIRDEMYAVNYRQLKVAISDLYDTLGAMEADDKITPKDASEISTTVKKITDKFTDSSPHSKIFYDAISEMTDFSKRWSINLLEKVVECQCGKPGGK